MSLLDTYNEMQKEAEVTAEKIEKIEILEKYASVAEELLSSEYDDYTAENVEKLASALIDHDMEVEEEQEKIAELDAAGRIMAKAYLDEISKTKVSDK